MKSIFFKTIVLCAILILSSCQSQEEKIISSLNDMAEQVKNDSDDWDAQDWADIATELSHISIDMKNCKFSDEQLKEAYKAQKYILEAIASKGADAYGEEMKSMLSGLEALSKEVDEDEDDNEDDEDSKSSKKSKKSEDNEESEDNEDDEDLDDKKEDSKSRKVYSKCFDGYLNIREKPNAQSKILGKLSNGPKGAELISNDGKWSKVRVNGVVGYAWSKDLQSTPTEPVHIDAGAVIGEWENEDYIDCNAYDIIQINNNGKFVWSMRIEGCADEYKGTWSLSRDKIVLKYSNGEKESLSVKGKKLFNGDSYYRKK